MGIGIVVPAYKILETINHPELAAIRRQVAEQMKHKSVPGMDSAKREEKAEQPPTFTKEDFEAALKKVSRKVDK